MGENVFLIKAEVGFVYVRLYWVQAQSSGGMIEVLQTDSSDRVVSLLSVRKQLIAEVVEQGEAGLVQIIFGVDSHDVVAHLPVKTQELIFQFQDRAPTQSLFYLLRDQLRLHVYNLIHVVVSHLLPEINLKLGLLLICQEENTLDFNLVNIFVLVFALLKVHVRLLNAVDHGQHILRGLLFDLEPFLYIEHP